MNRKLKKLISELPLYLPNEVYEEDVIAEYVCTWFSDFRDTHFCQWCEYRAAEYTFHELDSSPSYVCKECALDFLRGGFEYEQG